MTPAVSGRPSLERGSVLLQMFSYLIVRDESGALGMAVENRQRFLLWSVFLTCPVIVSMLLFCLNVSCRQNCININSAVM